MKSPTIHNARIESRFMRSNDCRTCRRTGRKVAWRTSGSSVRRTSLAAKTASNSTPLSWFATVSEASEHQLKAVSSVSDRVQIATEAGSVQSPLSVEAVGATCGPIPCGSAIEAVGRRIRAAAAETCTGPSGVVFRRQTTRTPIERNAFLCGNIRIAGRKKLQPGNTSQPRRGPTEAVLAVATLPVLPITQSGVLN
jgi:hypothetical protein